MIATLLSLLLLGMFGGDMTAQQYLSFSVSGAPTVRIQATNGSITLKTGGGSVSVTATKKADSQEKLGALKVTSSQSGNTITITAVDPQPCNDCGSIAFDATVPAGAKVELQTANGSIAANGLGGDSRMTTVNGSVHAAYASTSNVHAVALETTNGSITLNLPSNAKLGRVRGSTTTGRISSDWSLNIDRSNYVGSSLDQTVQSGGITINATTVNGSISIDKN
ncbi:MAG TPA: DUF4097 family beta strand repeat-containing protein [Candidatus Acidoferrales bacterium]|jgi:DUF4097 and DUF4098 domain-containing protein YvlB|nr:DUF4097 family beta strand repeat-containing protein [Candidatus Acidoferrales bacterium]